MQEKTRFRDRSALTAALAVLGLGIIILFCTVIIFSSVQCRKAVGFAEQGNTQSAIAQYDAMNGIGKALFGKKIKGSVLERYNLCLDSGNAGTVRELTDQMKVTFEDFDPVEYLPRMENCVEAALTNGDFAGAVEMIEYIRSLNPAEDFTSLQSVVEAKLNDLALAEDFDSADLLINAMPGCDLGGFVKGLANVSYSAVFSSAALNLSDALGEKLKNYRAISTKYALSAVAGGEALNAFLDYYIKGCNAYGTYSELHLLCTAVNSLMDNAEDYMESAFGFAGKRDVSHNYAREAYSYAVQAYNLAVKYDATQKGVRDYALLCADYIANAEAMMKWESNDVYISAMNKQPSLKNRRSALEKNGAADAGAMESYSKAELNDALRKVYEG